MNKVVVSVYIVCVNGLIPAFFYDFIGKIRVLVTNAEMEEPVRQIQTEATPVLARKASLELDVNKS